MNIYRKTLTLIMLSFLFASCVDADENVHDNASQISNGETRSPLDVDQKTNKILSIKSIVNDMASGMSYCAWATIEQIPHRGFGGRYLVDRIDYQPKIKEHQIRVSLSLVEPITDDAPSQFVLGHTGEVIEAAEGLVALGTIAMDVGEEIVIFASQQSLSKEDDYYLTTMDRIVRKNTDGLFTSLGWPDYWAESNLDDVVQKARRAYSTWKQAGKPKAPYVLNPFYTEQEWNAMEGTEVDSTTWCPCGLTYHNQECTK